MPEITNLLRRVQRPPPEPSDLLLLQAQQLRGPDGHVWNLPHRESRLLEILALLQDLPGAGNPIAAQRGKGYRLNLPLRIAPKEG